MGRKSPYPEEFRKDAVALYRAAAGQRTYAAVAADLGITAESLRTWVRKDEAGAVPEGRDGSVNTAKELARLRAENARLLKAEQEWRLEREILRRAAAYAEQVRTERQAEEKRTVSEIRAIHSEHQGAYGAPRVHAELRARGRRINRKRVTRLMRINHIVGRHLRKKKRATIADRAAPPTPDLVMRDFTADTLNTRWCGDITYIAVGATWLYLATVIDICSRKLVGWSIADHMRTSLVTDVIEMAVAARGNSPVLQRLVELAQYSAAAFAEVCRRHGIRRSMGRVGSSYDNALAESFFQGLKRELLHGRRWTSKTQTRLELFRWLSYYNRRRRHSALGYLTPAEFEQQLITSHTLSLVA